MTCRRSGRAHHQADHSRLKRRGEDIAAVQASQPPPKDQEERGELCHGADRGAERESAFLQEPHEREVERDVEEHIEHGDARRRARVLERVEPAQQHKHPGLRPEPKTIEEHHPRGAGRGLHVRGEPPVLEKDVDDRRGKRHQSRRRRYRQEERQSQRRGQRPAETFHVMDRGVLAEGREHRGRNGQADHRHRNLHDPVGEEKTRRRPGVAHRVERERPVDEDVHLDRGRADNYRRQKAQDLPEPRVRNVERPPQTHPRPPGERHLKEHLHQSREERREGDVEHGLFESFGSLRPAREDKDAGNPHDVEQCRHERRGEEPPPRVQDRHEKSRQADEQHVGHQHGHVADEQLSLLLEIRGVAKRGEHQLDEYRHRTEDEEHHREGDGV